MNSFHQIRIQHIHREGNQVADKLEEKGRLSDWSELQRLHRPPLDVVKLLLQDVGPVVFARENGFFRPLFCYLFWNLSWLFFKFSDSYRPYVYGLVFL